MKNTRYLIVVIALAGLFLAGCWEYRLTPQEEAGIKAAAAPVGTGFGIPPLVTEAAVTAILTGLSYFFGRRHGVKKASKAP